MRSILSFVANLLLYMSLTTMIFALGAYLAFKLKQKRKPTLTRSASVSNVKVLQAYQPRERE
jgi:uncharacterized BrkB/YihY/UPF0761 family membrane protein